MIVAGLDVDETRLAGVCERYGIGALMVFGSVARGSAGPSSDVDVLYELRPGHRLGWEIEDLADELSEVLGRPVDLVSRTGLHERMRAAVLAEARPLYAA
jgi:predicted nucleotidyltransferase